MPSTEFLLRLAVALLVIVSIGLVAATITTPTDPGDDGAGTGEGQGEGPGPCIDCVNQGDDSADSPPAFLEYLVYALLIIAALVFVWYLINYRRTLVKMGAATILAALILIAIVYLILELGAPPEFGNGSETVNVTNNSSGGGGTPGTDSQETDVPFDVGPLLGVLAVIATIFVGGLVLSNRSSSADEATSLEDPQESQNPEQAAVAAAAGRAADRISNESTTDVDNEVYRAWREMTDLLEVDRPESTTPREFAAAAVDAGLERDHVEELTELFEAVRYGHEATTDRREERAVAILRKIEATYGDDQRPDGGGTDR